MVARRSVGYIPPSPRPSGELCAAIIEPHRAPIGRHQRAASGARRSRTRAKLERRRTGPYAGVRGHGPARIKKVPFSLCFADCPCHTGGLYGHRLVRGTTAEVAPGYASADG